MKKSLIPIVFLSVLVIIAMGGAIYYYQEYQKAQKEIQTIRTDPNILRESAQKEADKLIDKVKGLIDMPGDEKPTVATITDIEKLKDQPFFRSAKNGDKVLIYTNAKRAIIFREETNKIIDIAPVNIGTPSGQQAQTARIVLRNGTVTAGLTATIESEIKKAYPNVNVTKKENAAKTDHEKTIVVILNQQASVAANSLAAMLGAQIGDLPLGELRPANTDILIIIGKDKITVTPTRSP